MNLKITNFTKELKLFVNKELKSNKVISADVLSVKNDFVEVSTKSNTDLTKNLNVEIDRIPAKVLDKKDKFIHLKMLKKFNFNLNQIVYIKNIQKDIIISKLKETLDNIENNKLNRENEETLKALFDKVEVNFSDGYFDISDKLNKNQRLAVERGLRADKFHIIQGPPGSGKTHTITEIIKQLYSLDKRILLTTHTHVALDNIIERLDDIDDNEIIRIGAKEKISSDCFKYSLDNQIRSHSDYSKVVEKEKRINILQNNHDTSEIKYSDSHSRGSILNKLFNFIFSSKENDNSLNNYKGNCINYDNYDEINQLKEEVNDIKNNIQHDIVQESKIIASTVLSSSSFLTRNIEFDYVIMDEASQVPVYLSLIPLLKTDKFIVIGDNKQLQPIKNKNSSYLLNKSIFNLLIEKYPENYTFLNIQYRMNGQISDIASKLYYDDKLLTYEKIKNKHITLKNNKSFLLNEDVITVIDTSNINYDETDVSGGCCNKYEVQLIMHILKALFSNGICEEEIGIITPYKKQKNYMQKKISEEKMNVECDTIYRFQGREKDVIIISFCKSLNKSLTKFQKKFLADKNQLNVSLTRARKKLIIIGNCSMLKSAENLKNLFDEVNPENIIFLDDFI